MRKRVPLPNIQQKQKKYARDDDNHLVSAKNKNKDEHVDLHGP